MKTTESTGIQDRNPLRVIVITEEDPFYIYEFFDKFISDPRFGKTIDVIEVIVQATFRESKAKLIKRMYGFWGFWRFLRMGIKYVFYRLKRRSMFNLFVDAGLQCRKQWNVNSKSFVKSVIEKAPDVLLSVAAPQIFKKPLLNAASWGCINVHSGPLPHYKGMLPTFWQMLHGEDKIGVTVHRMAPEIDGGEILKQEYMDFRSDEPLNSVIMRAKRMCAGMVMDSLVDIQQGVEELKPIDVKEGSYFSFPKPADVRRFRRQGGKLI